MTPYRAHNAWRRAAARGFGRVWTFAEADFPAGRVHCTEYWHRQLARAIAQRDRRPA